MSPVGTRIYAAPEVVVGRRVSMVMKDAPGVDIFSSGRLLRYMLTGLAPNLSYMQFLEQQGLLTPLLKTVRRWLQRRKLHKQKERSLKYERIVQEPSMLSDAAKDLLAKLLAPNLSERPTARELLNNAW
eukprot:CAMPEP_0119327762 /NCGR_PEP_ID=MMETSP1333-20130426/71617_1 /TAXON_ID=418940 /ORGANISM="Scyphosphaera apsteinii, Strain RCC1455" /LENGTH=128 /DNA_ID=CAMNT_0007336449 /DNA_START=206 /DNA_END=589 /DNA_ORIENTATION=-